MNKNSRQRKAKEAKQRKTGTKGVISSSPDRNMQMVVRHNRGPGAVGNCSNTSHEPIDKNKPFKPWKKIHYKYEYQKGLTSVSVGGENKETEPNGENS